MNEETSPPQPDKDPGAWAVLALAFAGFYFVWSLVATVVFLPLAALELLNDHVLHREQGWEDQFAPRPDLFLAMTGMASMVIYVIFVSRVDPSLRRGWRRYALTVTGLALGFALFAALVRLDLPEFHQEWWQGWG